MSSIPAGKFRVSAREANFERVACPGLLSCRRLLLVKIALSSWSSGNAFSADVSEFLVNFASGGEIYIYIYMYMCVCVCVCVCARVCVEREKERENPRAFTMIASLSCYVNNAYTVADTYIMLHAFA